MEDSGVEASLGKIFISTNGWTPVIPATWGMINRSVVVHAGPGKKQDAIPKLTKAKRAGWLGQVVEHLPSKCKILSSKLQYYQKKKNK
jgi:hypothetical protein